MRKSVTELAGELVAAGGGGLEELHVHSFDDDEAAHDDDAHERLYEQFSAELQAAVTELEKTYGEPLRSGASHDAAVPLNGVFRFAVWDVDGTELFLAASHEDRDCPILLMIGTT